MSFIRTIISYIYRHWLTVAFILGFVTDVFLLNQIDSVVDNLILLFHVTVATTALLLLYLGVAERLPGSRFLQKYTPIAMQYAFGGLLSGMLIFYGRSGDWIASAPFLLLIVAVMFGNEFVSKRSDRLVYHIALYFIGVFSYVVLVVPVITGRMGDWIFFFSGIIALLTVTMVVQILYKIVPHFMAFNTRRIVFIIGTIYVGFNILYITNIIPPIPLSLTQLEIAQSVERTGNSYRVVKESQEWWRQIPYTWSEIHPARGEVACFARVYAPTRLSTTIYHRWEYQDASGAWREHARVGYQIAGSNSGGYRGYTKITSFQSGVWRCSVETERGQVLGRETFILNKEGVPRPLVTYIE